MARPKAIAKTPFSHTQIWREAESIFKTEASRRRWKIDRTGLSLTRAHTHLMQSPRNGQGGSTINRSKITHYLTLIMNFGDQIMSGGPETASLVWMGVSTVGRVFIKDNEVSDLIQGGMEQLVATIFICEVYAKEHLRGRTRDDFTNTPLSVRTLLPEILAEVFKFFYHATKHVKSHRVKQLLKSSFSTVHGDLQGAIDAVTTKLRDLRATAEINFESTVLDMLQNTSDDLRKLAKLTNGTWESVEAFADKMEDIATEIRQQDERAESRRLFDTNLDWLTKDTPDLDSQVSVFLENTSKRNRHRKACRWIFKDPRYIQWLGSDPRFLWVHGAEGVGKSVLMSTVIEKFDNDQKQQQVEESPILVYFFCKSINVTQNTPELGPKIIMLHLCAQLFQEAFHLDNDDMDQQATMQKDCNVAVKEVKDKLSRSEQTIPSSMNISGLQDLFERLQKVMDKPTVVIVDALHQHPDVDLLEALKLLGNSTRTRVLVSSRSEPSPDVSRIKMDKEARSDFEAYAKARIEENLTPEENISLDTEMKKLVDATEGNFKRLRDIMDCFDRPGASLLPYGQVIGSALQDTYSSYLCRIEAMEDYQRDFLIAAFRWLICGEHDEQGKIPLLPLVNEFRKTHLYEGENYQKREEQMLRRIAKDLGNFGRGFVNVDNDNLLSLERSARDFVLQHKVTNKKDRISEARGGQGQLIMSEHLLQTLNLPQFQRRFLSVNALEEGASGFEGRGKHYALRYELQHWTSHVQRVELALKSKELGDSFTERWNKLLLGVHRFISDSKVFGTWLQMTTTAEEDRTKDDPVHTAARYGLVDLLKRYLGDDGTAVGKRNGAQNTPLHLVCLGEGNFRGLDVLLGHATIGHNIDLQNSDEATPILLATKSMTKCLKPMEDLLNKDANTRIPDKSLATCLHFAAASHNIEMCGLLLKERTGMRKVDVNARDTLGETPLHRACKWPNAPKALVRLLITEGAEVNAQDEASQAPLYEACSVGNVEVVRLLLRRKADIADDDEERDTALHAAVRSRNWDTVECLILHNSEKLIKNVKEAVQANKLYLEEGTQEHRRLISKEAHKAKAADIFKKNKAGQNAVACAASSREYDIMFNILRILMDRGWGMNVLLEDDRDKQIPLHTLIRLKAHDQVKLLLERVTLDLRQKMLKAFNRKGNDALHMAAHRGHFPIFQLLLSNGAQLDGNGMSDENYGNTVLDAAFRGWQRWTGISEKQSKCFEDIINYLIEARGVSVFKHAAKLYCAIERRSKRVCKLLLDWQSEKDKEEQSRVKKKRPKKHKKKASTTEHEKVSNVEKEDEREKYGKGWTASLVAAQYGFELPRPYSESNVDGKATLPPSAWSDTNQDARFRVEGGLAVSFTLPKKTTKKTPSKVKMSIRANNPVQPDKPFYFEVKVLVKEKDLDIGIGFCSKIAYLNSTMPGGRNTHALSWGYQGNSGKTYAQDQEGKSLRGELGAGDIIGCGLRLTERGSGSEIYFTRNGEYLDAPFNNVKGQLFPVLGIEGKSSEVKVLANFGCNETLPFEYSDANRS